MAITSAISNSYKLAVMSGTHSNTHTYKMALYTGSATIDGTNNAYVATNEVSDANYTAGGANLAGFTAALSANTAVLTFNNCTWANATFTARGCMIYNSNIANNNMVACYDFGQNVTGGGGNFTVVMPTANNTTGLIRIA